MTTASLDAFYAVHVKHFRLEGHLDAPFTPANGSVQGCPLSMLVLSSMIRAWHERMNADIPSAVPRSFADDISAATSAARPAQVRRDVQLIHHHTRDFTQLAGLQVGTDKSLTFGHESLQGSLPHLPNHKKSFRLTGGCVKVGAQSCWSDLEKARASKWTLSVSKIRRLPVGWFTKVTWLQRVSPQLTWSQGMRKLSIGRDPLKDL